MRNHDKGYRSVVSHRDLSTTSIPRFAAGPIAPSPSRFLPCSMPEITISIAWKTAIPNGKSPACWSTLERQVAQTCDALVRTLLNDVANRSDSFLRCPSQAEVPSECRRAPRRQRRSLFQQQWLCIERPWRADRYVSEGAMSAIPGESLEGRSGGLPEQGFEIGGAPSG